MFADIVGHARTLDLLARAVTHGPAHAYLFSGPASVGKRTIAELFARTLDCSDRRADGSACGGCRSCRLAASGGHPDIRLIDRSFGADERRSRPPKEIPIEAVRSIQRDASLSPSMGPWKVYIIDGADHLSGPGADALLKLLEEPPSPVIIILVCVDAGALPATVVSRCQMARFGPVRVDDIERFLVAHHGIAFDQAATFARLADGAPGMALAFSTVRPGAKAPPSGIAEAVELDAASLVDRLRSAEKIAADHIRDRARTEERLRWLGLWWRDILFARCGCRDLIVNVDRVPALDARAATISIADARDALKAIDETLAQIDDNVQTRLALELLMMRLPPAA